MLNSCCINYKHLSLLAENWQKLSLFVWFPFYGCYKNFGWGLQSLKRCSTEAKLTCISKKIKNRSKSRERTNRTLISVSLNAWQGSLKAFSLRISQSVSALVNKMQPELLLAPYHMAKWHGMAKILSVQLSSFPPYFLWFYDMRKKRKISFN